MRRPLLLHRCIARCGATPTPGAWRPAALPSTRCPPRQPSDPAFDDNAAAAAAGAWSIESTGIKYDCSQGALLRTASYSLFILFGISAVLEAVLTVLGLRGGPFDTQKRRWVGPLLGAEIVVWVLLLGFTSEY